MRAYLVYWITATVGGLFLLLGAATHVDAAPIFLGPTPYLSAADIPAGLYAGGGLPTALENFEDGSLDFGITASSGFVTVGPLSPFPSISTDSVDADDGLINNSGNNCAILGHS